MKPTTKPFPRRPWQPLMRSIDVADLDIDALVGAALENGIDSLIINAAGFMAFYPSEVAYQLRNPYMEEDFVGSVIKAAAGTNLQIYGRVDFSKGFETWYTAHPEWFVVDAEGHPVTYWEMYQTCLTGPYVQAHAFDVLDELLINYALDGLFFNFYYLPVCYCDRCQEEVRLVTGDSVPLGPAMIPAYERWRHRRLAEHTLRIRERIRHHRPKARLMAYHHLHKGWDPRLMAEVTDIWTAQISSPLLVNPSDPQPTWSKWPGEEARKGRALKQNVAPLLILSYSEMFASRRVLQPGDRLTSHMMQAAGHGGSPCPSLSGVVSRQEDTRPLQLVADLQRELQSLEHLLDREIAPKEISLLYSPDSLWFGPDQGRPQGTRYGHVAEFRGLYSILTDCRYPFDVQMAGSLTLDNLRSRRVIILPAVHCLDDRDATTLERWVREGGWIISTGDTGRANQDGIQKLSSTSLLFPELSLHQESVDGAYLKIQSPARCEGLGGTTILGVAGPMWTFDRKGSATDLHLLGPFANNNPEFAFWQAEPPPGSIAGLSRLSIGRGGIIWLPWYLGALYYHYAIPEYHDLLGCELGTVLGPSPIQTDAPLSVEIVFNEAHIGKGVKQWTLFLINDTASAGRTRLSTISLCDLTINLRCPATRASEEPSGEKIELQRNGEWVSLRIPYLQGHKAFLLE